VIDSRIQQDIAGPRPRCAGLDFEQHERTEPGGGLTYRWRCPDCGDTGSIETVLAKLLGLHPLLDRLQEQMLDRGVAFLLPSDASPGHLGQCFGRPVFRVPGISQPMIAITATGADVTVGKALAARIDYGPAVPLYDAVTGDEVGRALTTALTAFLDWPVWLREDGLTCEKPDCPHEDCQNVSWGPVCVSETGHTTLRAILEGLRVHAGAAP
jgi:hypothetical protein